MLVLPSCRNQSIALLCKSIDWFLYYEGNIFVDIAKENKCDEQTKKSAFVGALRNFHLKKKELVPGEMYTEFFIAQPSNQK